MRNQPEMSPDPYRTLGLEPGASIAEVKRAYRRLAKAFHPDSAGEAALPRFLAIHEAYERLRTGGAITGVRPARGAPPAAEPWRADPERARTARERARASRPRPGAARPGTGGATGTPGAAQGTSGGSSRAGSTSGARPSGTAGAPGSHSGRTGSSAASGAGAGGFGRARGGGRRETRKATLGSTSYDDARDPSDASWSGASWYGPTTGEYWIVNPREYADPRKHGPDYQSRARRPAEAGDPGEHGFDDREGEDIASVAEPSDSPESMGWGSGTGAGREARPGLGGRRWAGAAASPAWDSATGAYAGESAFGRPRASATGASTTRASTAGASAAGASATRGSATAAGPGRTSASATAAPRRGPRWDRLGDVATARSWSAPLGSARRDWLGGRSDDPIRRLGLALVAWPPIGLAAAAVIGELTGCATFSATCGGSDSLLPWLAQAGILGLLLLLPPIARLLAGGALAVLVALVPVTGFLVVVGAAGAPQAGFALAVLLALVWLAGVGWSLVTERRRETAERGGVVP